MQQVKRLNRRQQGDQEEIYLAAVLRIILTRKLMPICSWEGKKREKDKVKEDEKTELNKM